MRRSRSLTLAVATLTLLLAVALGVPGLPSASAVSTVGSGPSADPFYSYSGENALSEIAPGTVLKTRTIPFSLEGIATPLKAVQLLYRSTSATGEPTTNVTSVVEPLGGPRVPGLVSYQSFYDTLNPADEPSVSIAGGVSIGGQIASVESVLIQPLLALGYGVIITDTEGQRAVFGAGKEYGYNTLDAIRAAVNSSAVGASPDAKVGLVGYSGGAIASEWASELAPTYAPDLSKRLVGTAMGGVFVDPLHNIVNISGSLVWSSGLPMILAGFARAYGIDLSPYLSAYGQRVLTSVENASLVNVLGRYGGLTFANLMKPQYSKPQSIPPLLAALNDSIMGTGGIPAVPLFIGQGNNAAIEGSLNQPYGPGDGAMISGDVRTLARQYCADGVAVDYEQYALTSHLTSLPQWLAQAVPWLLARMSGSSPAPNNCASIAPGNSIAPMH